MIDEVSRYPSQPGLATAQLLETDHLLSGLQTKDLLWLGTDRTLLSKVLSRR